MVSKRASQERAIPMVSYGIVNKTQPLNPRALKYTPSYIGLSNHSVEIATKVCATKANGLSHYVSPLCCLLLSPWQRPLWNFSTMVGSSQPLHTKSSLLLQEGHKDLKCSNTNITSVVSKLFSSIYFAPLCASKCIFLF